MCEAQRLEGLTRQLGDFVPDVVVYIERGGRALGEALARCYGVSASPLDIAYPLSRLPHSVLRGLVFPIKEIAYRLTGPRLHSPFGMQDVDATADVLLVDDTASSGKTLQRAREALWFNGHRGEIRVVVARAGKRVAPKIDAAIRQA